MPTPSAPEPLQRLVEPLVREAGLDLEELRVSPAGRRRLMRVVVDADGGVDLDSVAALSQRLSAVLDGSDLMGKGAYVLEVTSPGVDRPLTQHKHWRRAIGRLVRAQLRSGHELLGRVEAVDADAVTVDVDGKLRTVPFAEVGQAHVEVEFRRGGKDEGPDDEAAGDTDGTEPDEEA